MTILDLINEIIGTTFYVLEISPDGFPIVVYSVPYIMSCVMLYVAFRYGVIKWITIVVEKCFNLGGK